MLANLILVIISVLVIAFMWLMWLRHAVLQKARAAEQKQKVLMGDLAKRRDTVPYLLESYRAEAEPDEEFRKVLEDRKFFHTEESLEKEWEFEKTLIRFLRDKQVRNLNFLEAKKDIQDLTTIIEKEKVEMQGAIEAFNAQRKRFPYSLASAIFGLHKA